MTDGKPLMVLFGTGRLNEMLAKGNVWYVRHYEAAFARVHVAYLIGSGAPVTQGRTTLTSLGGSFNGKIDFLLAPFRFYRFCRRVKPQFYLTADQWFCWWTSALVRLLLGARVVLMPVCIPEQLYASSGITVLGFPRWIDKLLIALSFRAAHRVWTAEAFGDYVRWLGNDPLAKSKLVVTRTMVEVLPTPAFLDAAAGIQRARRAGGPLRLIYVGRLHPEKLVDHLLDVMAELTKSGKDQFRLTVIGDGAQLAELKRLSVQLGIGEAIDFRGALPNGDLPAALAQADVFVSPLTGTSLREAALCGLAVVAYDRDWLRGVLVHEATALLVPPDDKHGFATAILRLRDQPELRLRLADNVQALARELWSPAGVAASLHEIYHAAASP